MPSSEANRPRRHEGTECLHEQVASCLSGSVACGSGMSSMHMTSFDEFKDLAQRGTFVPVYKEIVADMLTPVSAFLKVAEHADYAFLLESVEGGEQVARYSFLGKDPFLVLRAAGEGTSIEQQG